MSWSKDGPLKIKRTLDNNPARAIINAATANIWPHRLVATELIWRSATESLHGYYQYDSEPFNFTYGARIIRAREDNDQMSLISIIAFFHWGRVIFASATPGSGNSGKSVRWVES